MPGKANDDTAAMLRLRAASEALKKHWGDGDDPKVWRGVTWSEQGRVVVLNLQGISELIVLPAEIGLLGALVTLRLSGCSQLKKLPDEIGQLEVIEELNLGGCGQLKELPTTIGQLHALVKLNLGGCSALTGLPDEIGGLHALESLNLDQCLQLTALPTTVGKLNALTSLNVSGCLQIKMLPDEIADLTTLTKLDLSGCSKLKVLPAMIGQLQVLTELLLGGCSGLTGLPATFAHLGALGTLDLKGCDKLTLAPGAELSTPAKDIVVAYASHLFEPYTSSPQLEQLSQFIVASQLNKKTFFKSIITNSTHAAWLGEAVKANRSLADLAAPDGRRAIDVAVPACKERMQAALFLLGRFEVDEGSLRHRSLTSAVAAATDHAKAKPAPRMALKAMQTAGQLCAELEGRVGLDHKHTITVVAIFADKKAVDQEAESWNAVVAAANRLDVKLECTPVTDLSSQIKKHFNKPKHPTPSGLLQIGNAAGTQIAEQNSPPTRLSRQNSKLPEIVKDAMKKMAATELTGEYPFLLVMRLADRTLLQTIDHDQLAGRDFTAIRDAMDDFAYALEAMHTKGVIHADFKPLNAVFDGINWKIIDFDVSCKLGQPFGCKPPSSGYCPPEMARVLLRAMNEKGEVDGEMLAEYRASVAYDLWCFGVVLYHLCFGRPLWLTDINDNVTREDLCTLASVSDAEPLRKVLNKAMYDGERRDAPDNLAAATALLRKLLEPNATKRLAHFDSAPTHMKGVLDEPFFKGMTLDFASMEVIVQNQEKQMALLAAIKELSLENKIELLHTRKALMKGIFEATEVKTPTTFIILDEMLSAEEPREKKQLQEQLLSLKEDGSGIELAGNLKIAKERLDKAKTWLERLKTFGEGAIENNPNKVFGQIKEVFAELITKETMYFYLVDELTGLPVRGAGYPIKITKPSEIVPKLLPVMQVGMRAMSLYNGVAGVAQMVGYPVPKVPEAWRKSAQSSVEMLKQVPIYIEPSAHKQHASLCIAHSNLTSCTPTTQESSVEKFGAVHSKVQEGHNEETTTRGASLRELQRFFKDNDPDERYAGLRRVADEDGTAVWTILKETDVAAQLEKRAGERREEEQIFSDQTRTSSEASTKLQEQAAVAASTMPKGGGNDGKGSESNNSTRRTTFMTVDNNHGCVICSLQ